MGGKDCIMQQHCFNKDMVLLATFSKHSPSKAADTQTHKHIVLNNLSTVNTADLKYSLD